MIYMSLSTNCYKWIGPWIMWLESVLQWWFSLILALLFFLKLSFNVSFWDGNTSRYRMNGRNSKSIYLKCLQINLYAFRKIIWITFSLQIYIYFRSHCIIIIKYHLEYNVVVFLTAFNHLLPRITACNRVQANVKRAAHLHIQ